MLSISHLNKTYPNGVKALHDATLRIGKGIFGLLGPNGAGKSSLMRTLATLQEPDSGSIHFGDIDVVKHKGQMRQVLGYLPQEFGVYPSISAEDLLDHLAILKGIIDRKKRKQEVDFLLEMTHLSPHRKKKLGGFSGGMKQRFGIAQALLGRPQVIIVDEPTAGLDPSERDRFHTLLAQLSQEITVILSTHIVSDVSALCNDMAILSGGRVLAHMAPAEAMARLEGKVWKTIESVSSQQVISTRYFQGSKWVKVYSLSQPPGAFTPSPPDLEDVYFSVLQGYPL